MLSPGQALSGPVHRPGRPQRPGRPGRGGAGKNVRTVGMEKRDFELKLGKLGVVLFTLGIACLPVVSFIFGRQVRWAPPLNIEKRPPEDIALASPA